MTNPYYIGVDVGGTSIRAARFTGESHEPEFKTKVATQAANGLEAVLERIAEAVAEVLPAVGAVAGVGIAAPGPLDPHQGIVFSAPNLPGWEKLPLKRLMAERLKLPVFIGNDANLAGLGEWKFGAGKGHNDVLYLTISTGIGGGVITGGRMLVGARGLAAEVGHILAIPDGPLCGCGQRGHLEAIASGTALARVARTKLKAGGGSDSKLRELCQGDLEGVTAVLVGEAALAGDEFALRLVAEAGTFIGRTTASLLHAYNPSIIVCGGGVSLLGDILFDPMRKAIRQYAMNDIFWRDCPVVPAQLGDDAGLVGAASLVMEETAGK